ncbi:MAG: polysaccharide biosynthesis C-terminal domain-containing protein [Planctomycetes bacterium]|nr:polysaccharide biosynthesis C-terminal domain-containing protein [Planctomycetota bacterium]
MAARLWTFSGPLLLSGLCGFVLHQADRFFVLGASGTADVGVYGLCYKLGSIGNALVFEAFALIWYPFVFGVREEEHLKRLIRAVLVYFTLVMSVVSLALALFSPELVRVMADASFFDAHRGLPLVAAGYLFWSVYQIVSTVFFVRERTWMVSALVAGAAVLNLALNALLVPRMGWMGAAWATCATFGALAAAAWIVAERAWRVGHETVRVLTPPAVGIALYAASCWIDAPAPVAAMTIKAGLVLALPGILWMSGYLKAEEKDKLRELVRKGRSAAGGRG